MLEASLFMISGTITFSYQWGIVSTSSA